MLSRFPAAIVHSTFRDGKLSNSTGAGCIQCIHTFGKVGLYLKKYLGNQQAS